MLNYTFCHEVYRENMESGNTKKEAPEIISPKQHCCDALLFVSASMVELPDVKLVICWTDVWPEN